MMCIHLSAAAKGILSLRSITDHLQGPKIRSNNDMLVLKSFEERHISIDVSKDTHNT